MKTGILLIISGILLLCYGLLYGKFYLLFIWPAASFGIVGFAYLFNNPMVFGKNEKGKLNILNLILLFPYLIYLYGTWHFLRFVKAENSIDRIDENLFIGRRLSAGEFPDNIITVVDLTCEFYEPQRIVNNTDYRNFKILDASIPDSERLADFIIELSSLNNTIFIHCAEGHGRTALVAALLLVAKGRADTFDEAYKILKRKRPLIRLNKMQHRCAQKCVHLLNNKRENA